MRFLHLADLHIGKQLYGYSLLEEQEKVLEWVADQAKERKVDAVLMAGDIYDKAVPSAEAVGVFDHFLTVLSSLSPEINILIIAGNHDNATRLDFASDILAKHKVYIAGMPPRQKNQYLQQVALQDEFGPVHFYLMPYLKPGYVKQLTETGEIPDSYEAAVKMVLEREQINQEERNVILAHQFFCSHGAEPETCESETRMVGGLEQVDADCLLAFDYGALGHIHGPQRIGKDSIRYGGTLLKYSVSEERHHKCLTMVELFEKKDEPKITSIPVPLPRNVRTLRGTLKELCEDTSGNTEDFVRIVLTDEVESYRPREILEQKYTHILEIQIDNQRTKALFTDQEEQLVFQNPREAFYNFFELIQHRKMTEEEAEELNQVMQLVEEEQR